MMQSSSDIVKSFDKFPECLSGIEVLGKDLLWRDSNVKCVVDIGNESYDVEGVENAVVYKSLAGLVIDTLVKILKNFNKLFHSFSPKNLFACLVEEEFAVYFAICRQRHRVEFFVLAGDHISRNKLEKIRGKLRRSRLADVIKYDLFLLRGINGADLTHTLAGRCGGFDLAKLDAVTHMLDL